MDIDCTEEVHVAHAIFLTNKIDSWNNFLDQIAQIMGNDQKINIILNYINKC